MCIAAIINTPVEADYLQEMEKDNPHGAGVAWFDGTSIQFRRGLKAAQIWEMQTSGEMSYPYLLHFRWATHGAQVPELTHPFPTGPRALFGELTGAADSVLIHNGVWNQCTKYEDFIEAPGKVIDSTSDTGILAYLVGEYEWSSLLKDVPWATALAFVFDGTMVISKYGDTWTTFEGNEYSNLYWLPASVWWEHNKDSVYAKARAGKSVYGVYSGGWEGGDDWYAWAAEKTEADKRSAESKANAAATTRLARMTDEEWEEYIRTRYGHCLADESKETPEDDTDILDIVDAVTLTGMVSDVPDDDDLVSEIPEVVNAWIEKQETKRMSKVLANSCGIKR